jgi:hypothetical protein
MRRILFLLLLNIPLAFASAVRLSDEQALAIGRRIWKNECAGTVSGLTSWNKGEEFPSLGIGHFIWYPAGKRGPFEESFPGLVKFLAANGTDVPAWTQGPCPWATRSAFLADIDGPRLGELRRILAATVALQARYAAMRLENALPRMLAAAPPAERSRIEENFQRVASQPLGFYALMDYVNFKGEGVNPSERYKGAGWGLLQVLEAMPDSGNPLAGFAAAADDVLTRRVRNSPPERNESKWLAGWRNRIQTYAN